MKKLFIIVLAVALFMVSCTATNNKPIVTPVESTPVESDTDNVETDVAPVDNQDWKSALDAEPFDYTGKDLSSYINCGQYTGLTVNRADDSLTDEELADQLTSMLNSYSEYKHITEGIVYEGNTAYIDYAGYLENGEALEFGSAENAEVIAADGNGYIDGFGSSLIGQTIGEEYSFNVVFPEDYQKEALRGVPVTFVCTVNYVLGNELISPELTDEFVSEKFGIDTVEEFRKEFKESIQSSKTYQVDQEMCSNLWQTIVDNAEVLKYPEGEVERVYAMNRQYYEDTASSYQIDYETFLSNYARITDEDMWESSRDYVKDDLVLYALLNEMNISITDEEYNQEIEKIAYQYGATADQLIEYYGEESLRTTVSWQKLMDTILNQTNVVYA